MIANQVCMSQGKQGERGRERMEEGGRGIEIFYCIQWHNPSDLVPSTGPSVVSNNVISFGDISNQSKSILINCFSGFDLYGQLWA